MVNSLLMIFNDSLFVFVGIPLQEHGMHDNVSLSISFFAFLVVNPTSVENWLRDFGFTWVYL